MTSGTTPQAGRGPASPAASRLVVERVRVTPHGTFPRDAQALRPPGDGERRAKVFGGRVIVFSAAPAAFRALRDRALALMVAELGDEPSLAHRWPPEAFFDAVLTLQARFSADLEIRDAWQATLDALGVASPRFADQRFLRVLPPVDGPNRGRVAPLHPHRDTWGSQIMAQENWWAPVLPVSARSTLALYPRYWTRAVANDSREWSFETFLERRRAAGAAGPVGYRSAPQALAPIPVSAAVPLPLAPGELAVFSGAHLHGSVPNRSGLCRFSFETRSVVLRDGRLPAGAPNVDGAAGRPRLEWFRDEAGTTLADALARR